MMLKLSPILCVLLFLIAATWFALASVNADRWPGGASPTGLTFGIVGGAIILFDAAYALRRRLMNWQLGPRPAWLRAHVLLGILSLPLIAMHSGFRSGGVFSTTLISIYSLVMTSGVGLLWLQRRGAALADVSPSRIDVLRLELARQVRELIEQACGVASSGDKVVTAEHVHAVDHIVLETEHTTSRLRGRVAEVHVQRMPLPGGEQLLPFWSDVVKPFFDAAPPESSLLRNDDAARREFASLRGRLGPGLAETTDRLQACCRRRRELLELERQRARIELWSLVHSPLTAALVVMTIAHAFVAWRIR